MIRRLLALPLLAGLLSCGGDPTEPPGPQAGVVVASLNTPNDSDGALLIRIIGEHTQLKAAGSYRLATGSTPASTTVRVVLSGAIAGGDVLEFTVPDINKLSMYALAVEQAAARNTYALLDPSGYNISLRVK